ncbi:uncharacterized protein E0L32_001728 [Thyridium curvatum]|uniref:Calcineurin-like phosphoesterase domain-containing protein n=1 Tax=Thyridium curvatum TaxID=1093900 RepID=A0A507AWR5_9PEZI|nr:uncharacterized protein E0L32_001471 [Thyridium curvatum]XP_030990979.1 uncharacterized protein E0L32_001728 [Thyridium curvatum]TPX09011.1 hypothetical protein E0L32_001471 [Thyridium curvatum]TPX09268.1 hypothetical protein E0L32_001728 [Thyridium curvatum]
MGLLETLGLRRTGPFEPPTVLDALLSSPLQALVTRLYHLLLFLRGRPFVPHRTLPVRVVCVSDTHDQIVRPLPDGDLLIHAGDLTNAGTAADIQRQIDWLHAQPHEHKVLVCGNHDSWFDPKSRSERDRETGAALDFRGVRYLQHEAVTLEFKSGRTLNLYGAGDIPKCSGDGDAFAIGNLEKKKPVSNTNETRTRGRTPSRATPTSSSPTPHPRGAGSHKNRYKTKRYHLDLSLGCAGLLDEVWRVRPRLHVFGHVHWGRGREAVYFDDCQRAYESLMARRRRDQVGGQVQVGPLRDLVPGPAWLDALRVLLHGLESVLFKVLMQGPGTNQASLMVNAGQMLGNTGKLGGKVEIVDM